MKAIYRGEGLKSVVKIGTKKPFLCDAMPIYKEGFSVNNGDTIEIIEYFIAGVFSREPVALFKDSDNRIRYCEVEELELLGK